MRPKVLFLISRSLLKLLDNCTDACTLLMDLVAVQNTLPGAEVCGAAAMHLNLKCIH